MSKTDKYIDRPFNIRPLCFWAILVMLTIICCRVSVWLGFVFTLCLFVFLGLPQFIKSKDKTLEFFKSSRMFAIGAIILCTLTFASFFITGAIYKNAPYHAGIHELSGTVEKYTMRPIEEGVSLITLSNAKFNGKNVDGKIIVFVNGYDEGEHGLSVGGKVSMQTRLEKTGASDININTGVKYSASTRYSNLVTDPNFKSKELKHVVTNYINNFLHDNMTSRNAGLLYSMLFGDTSELDYGVQHNFRTLGLFHVIAVSGFNVAIIMVLLFPILKICRVRLKTSFFIIAGVLLFYCYLCNFTFSIVRATIMFLILLFNKIFLRKSDLLSGICASMVLLLIFMPYALYSWSFAMTHVCMFGIALFYEPIERKLKKTIHPRSPMWLENFQVFIIKLVTLYIAVNISVFPFTVKYFGVFPTYGIISNVLFLPILTFSCCVAIVAFTTWIGRILLPPIDALLVFSHRIMDWIASWKGSLIYISNGGAWFAFYLVALIFCTRFIFIKKPIKYGIAGLLFAIYCIGFMV